MKIEDAMQYIKMSKKKAKKKNSNDESERNCLQSF